MSMSRNFKAKLYLKWMNIGDEEQVWDEVRLCSLPDFHEKCAMWLSCDIDSHCAIKFGADLITFEVTKLPHDKFSNSLNVSKFWDQNCGMIEEMLIKNVHIRWKDQKCFDLLKWSKMFFCVAASLIIQKILKLQVYVWWDLLNYIKLFSRRKTFLSVLFFSFARFQTAVLSSYVFLSLSSVQCIHLRSLALHAPVRGLKFHAPFWTL